MVVVEVRLLVEDYFVVWVILVIFGVIFLLVVMLDFSFMFCVYLVFLVFFSLVVGNDFNKVVIVDVGLVFKMVIYF